MESSYLFILELAIILAVAHLAGMLSSKFKQPVVLGRIIAGIIIGVGFMEKTEMKLLKEEKELLRSILLKE